MRWVSPVITVRDVTASLRFYTEVLEFDEWFRWGGSDENPETVGVMHGHARVICDKAGAAGLPPQAGAGVELYFDVGEMDIDNYYARLRQRGVMVTEPIADKPWGDRLFRIVDPDGYRLTFAKTLSASLPSQRVGTETPR